MKKYYFKISENLFLIYFKIFEYQCLENISNRYVLIDSFFIDYNEKEIKEIKEIVMNGNEKYIYLISSNLFRDEELVIFSQNDLFRPTSREPLIRGLYALASRHTESSIVTDILKIISSESTTESKESLIKSVFSHKDRK